MGKGKIGQIWAILGIVNANIGSGALIIPIAAMNAGYLAIPFIVIMMGLFSMYTAWILMVHQGNLKSIREMMVKHFGYRSFMFRLYGICLFLGLFGGLVVYFELLVRQLTGLFPQLQDGQLTLHICIFVILSALTISMKHFKFDLKVLGIGIVGTIAFCAFLIWILFQQNSDGEKKQLEAFGPDIITFVSILSSAYSIHEIIAVVLVQNTQPKYYGKVVKISFMICMCVYMLGSYSCYGFVSRKSKREPAETIFDYFSNEEWEMNFIYILFTYHFFTVCPEYMISIGNYVLQFVDSFRPQSTAQDSHIMRSYEEPLNLKQVLIYIFLYAICLLISLTKVNILILTTLRGVVFSALATSFIPIIIHLTCIYGRQSNEQKGGQSSGPIQHEGQQNESEFEIYCQKQVIYANGYHKYGQMFLMVFILLFMFFCSLYQLNKHLHIIKIQQTSINPTHAHFLFRKYYH